MPHAVQVLSSYLLTVSQRTHGHGCLPSLSLALPGGAEGGGGIVPGGGGGGGTSVRSATAPGAASPATTCRATGEDSGARAGLTGSLARLV